MALFWSSGLLLTQRFAILCIRHLHLDSSLVGGLILWLAERTALCIDEMHECAPHAGHDEQAHELRDMAQRYHGGPYLGWM